MSQTLPIRLDDLYAFSVLESTGTCELSITRAHYSHAGPATKKRFGVLLPLETTPALPNHDDLMKTLQPPMTIQAYAAIPHTTREAHAPQKRKGAWPCAEYGRRDLSTRIPSPSSAPSVSLGRPSLSRDPSPRARQALFGSRLPERGSTSPASRTGHTQVMLSRIRAYVPARPRSCTFSPCSPRNHLTLPNHKS
jgi:hypothetical protein